MQTKNLMKPQSIIFQENKKEYISCSKFVSSIVIAPTLWATECTYRVVPIAGDGAADDLHLPRLTMSRVGTLEERRRGYKSRGEMRRRAKEWQRGEVRKEGKGVAERRSGKRRPEMTHL